jgi:hypothetical protein
VARADNGKRCSRPAFIRPAGTTQIVLSKFTSDYGIPKISPDYECTPGQGRSPMKPVAICHRANTPKQDTDNRRQLEGDAERSGWNVVRIYKDAGIPEPRAGTNDRGSIQ